MRIRIKICGITTREAADAAAALGIDAVGFVFADSPRKLDPHTAQRLTESLPPFVTRVGVFRYPQPAEVERVISVFDPHVIQTEPSADIAAAVAGRAEVLPVFHDGDDLLDRVAAYRTASRHDPTVLLEPPGRGGRGVVPDWSRAAVLARSVRLVLAGGLTPDSVTDAIRTVRPHAVDVSSGVESRPGVKDIRRMEAFVAAVRKVQGEMEPPLEIPS